MTNFLARTFELIGGWLLAQIITALMIFLGLSCENQMIRKDSVLSYFAYGYVKTCEVLDDQNPRN